MKFFSDKLLSGALLVAMFMVAVEVPLWVGFFSLFFVFWKWLSESSEIRRASKKLTGFLSLFLLGIVLFRYRTLVGQEPAYSYLLALTALKIMDYESLRDRRFVILLGFILVSVKALFSVDIYWLVPTLFSFFSLWLSLFSEKAQNRLRIFQRLSLWSLPLTIILFFAFPRVVLPWAMSQGHQKGQIGFSDSLMPGKVAELAAQDQMVMRVKFFQDMRLSQLYWRGSVLKESLGLSWGAIKMQTLEEKGALEKGSGTYEIALEPLNDRYLFVLDGTTALRLDGNLFQAYQEGIFRLMKPSKQTLFYDGIVRDSVGGVSLNKDFSEDDLKVPDLPPLTKSWVQKTRAQNATIEDRLSALDRFFKEDNFIYTLKPGIYGPNGLDEFLFNRKQGFCEHYAGAYGTLARSLGIPSRVVIGYQGGRFNPWGNFWLVSQKDAHAWVEIYMHGKWLRKDPTQWVAPLRFEIGADEFFSLTPEQQIQFAKNIEWKPKSDGVDNYFELISIFFENLNYHWTYFLIEFDLSTQREILTSILSSDQSVSWIVGFVIASFFSILLVFQIKKILEFDEVDILQEIKVIFQIPEGTPPYSALEKAIEKDLSHQEFYRNLQVYIDQKWYQETLVSNWIIVRQYFVWLKIKRQIRRRAEDLT